MEKKDFIKLIEDMDIEEIKDFRIEVELTNETNITLRCND